MTLRMGRSHGQWLAEFIRSEYGGRSGPNPSRARTLRKKRPPPLRPKVPVLPQRQNAQRRLRSQFPEGIKEAASMGIFGKASDPEASPIIRALSYENQIKMPPQGKASPRNHRRRSRMGSCRCTAPAATHPPAIRSLEPASAPWLCAA